MGEELGGSGVVDVGVAILARAMEAGMGASTFGWG